MVYFDFDFLLDFYNKIITGRISSYKLLKFQEIVMICTILIFLLGLIYFLFFQKKVRQKVFFNVEKNKTKLNPVTNPFLNQDSLIKASTENYDYFEPFQKIVMKNFIFSPSRFEIWKGRQIVQKGKTNYEINFTTVFENDDEKLKVTFGDKKLNSEISEEIIFDFFITSGERLVLATIPEKTNTDCSDAFINVKMDLGVTRDFKLFKENEPFVSSVFLKKEIIQKITFTFSTPSKLIKFYI